MFWVLLITIVGIVSTIAEPCDYIKYVRRDCLSGSQIHFMYSDGTADHDNCQEWCKNNSTCAGFTYQHYLECYFKAEDCRNDRPMTYDSNAVLYIKQDYSEKGLTYYSEDAVYRKLISNIKQDYNYWDEQCRGLGDRWAPAVINSAFELIFIREIQKRMDTLSYWISGSTDSRDGAPVTFYEYMPNLNGIGGVFISIKDCGTCSPYHFLPISQRRNFQSHSILCETSGLSFHSESNTYQKLVSSTPQNLSSWTAQCSEIGPGWAPAIIKSTSEYTFIEKQHQLLHNNVSFWIGGATIAEGRCNYFKHVDGHCLPGNNLHALRSDGTAYHYNCIEWCNNNSTCGGFALSNDICYFKNEACRNDIMHKDSVVLYLKPERCDYIKLMNSHCSPWNNLHTLRSDGTADHNNCMEWCNNNSTCVGFTAPNVFCYFNSEYCRNITYRNSGDLYLKLAYHPAYYFSIIDDGNDNEIIQLNSGSLSMELHGILCENDGASYQSYVSFYKKIMGSTTLNYPYWSHKCAEIGAGWHPAFAEDHFELALYYVEQKYLSDDREYWFQGSDWRLNTGEHEAATIISDTNFSSFRPEIDQFKSPKSHIAFGILCENDGLTFQRENSFYKKLVHTIEFDYKYWEGKCSELKYGWYPAIMNSAEELDFVLKNNLSNIQDFFIGGTTSLTSPGFISNFSDYLANSSGIRKVFLTNTNDSFMLAAATVAQVLPAILCEADRFKFQSNHSFYQIVTNTSYRRDPEQEPKDNNTVWQKQCEDLGTGWGLAILNSAEELDFIFSRRLQLHEADILYLGVGGSTDYRGHFRSYSDYFQSYEGIYQVVIGTFTFEEMIPQYHSFLVPQNYVCEKAKG